ncbi:immunoglobulin lambda-1 light chain-like isoform X1, partial [Lates japonicus]
AQPLPPVLTVFHLLSSSPTKPLCVFISFSLSSPHTPTLLTSQLDNVDAAKVLTQTPAVHTVSTGQEVVLNCNIQRDDGNYVRWLQPPSCPDSLPPRSAEPSPTKPSLLVCLSSLAQPV